MQDEVHPQEVTLFPFASLKSKAGESIHLAET